MRPHRRTNAAETDLVAVAALALILMVVSLAPVVLPALAVLRALALPLVLVLPGYALLEAARPQAALDLSARLLLIAGLSLAATALSGLLLNLLPIGLRPVSWALWLGVLTVSASAIALLRRHGGRLWIAGWQVRLAVRTLGEQAATLMRSGPGDGGLRRLTSARVRLLHGTLWLVALSLLGGAIVVARTGAADQPYPGFTELWMVPAPNGGATAVDIGVANHEQHTTQYVLVLTIDGAVAQSWRLSPMRPSQEWTVNYTVPSSASSTTSARYVLVTLYRASAPQVVYRQVARWIISATPTAGR